MVRAIAVERVSKGYRLGDPEGVPLRQRLARSWRRLRHGESEADLFWALRDVAFEVKEGEVVGVIGHNGAGKSTLLKILSRITEPTRGAVRVRGRMGSLLEVGTGFHPDLSGRDNVHMNAAILGMDRATTRKRFDEIVEFAGVREFIDTPIKHYSSGMKVRLAFAVAAHLDPEILLIDEVLAVGDATFQKKCLSRIEAVGASGRTILFVSHHLPTVARLCQRTIVLDHGRVAFDGKSIEAIRIYNEMLGSTRTSKVWGADAPGDAVARLRAVEIVTGSGPASGPIDVRQRVGVRMRYSVAVGGRSILPSFYLLDGGGDRVFAALDLDPRWHGRPRGAGEYESTAWIPANLLNEGAYKISAVLVTLDPIQQHCYAHDCVGFTIFDPMQGGTSRGQFEGDMPGYVRPLLEWETRQC